MRTIHLLKWAHVVPGGAARRTVRMPSDELCIITKAALTVIPQPGRLALVFAALKINSVILRLKSNFAGIGNRGVTSFMSF